jgi:hypothetical protein
MLFFFVLGSHVVLSQNKLTITEVETLQDTLKKPKVKINPLAPSKAAFYSAIFPGLGQIYNKKYWKLPLVYGAIGTGVYAYVWNNKQYNDYRDAYKSRLTGAKNDKFEFLDDARLIQGQKFYQKNRDLASLITVGLYILNIVDANVDAHLLQFNVSDDLSFKPDLHQNQIDNRQNIGLTFCFKF